MHNSVEGPVALLGSGSSINDIDLATIRTHMPFIGINESWRFWEEQTPRVFIDYALQIGPAPEYAVYAKSPHPTMKPIPPLPWDCATIGIPWQTSGEKSFSFDLEFGTYGINSGLFALEWAVWLGHNPIILLGFDCQGAHCYDENKQTTKRWFDVARYHLDLSIDACRERGVDVVST